MIWVELSLCAVLGALGSLWHLWFLKRRVAWITSGHPARGLLTLPLGLVGPALGVLAAAAVAPDSAWATLAGMLLSHSVLLGRHRSTT